MGFMTIDGRKVEFTDEKNVLSVIRKAGIDLPTLCYHSELSTFGACRLCTVEDDRGRTFALSLIHISENHSAIPYSIFCQSPSHYPLNLP